MRILGWRERRKERKGPPDGGAGQKKTTEEEPGSRDDPTDGNGRVRDKAEDLRRSLKEKKESFRTWWNSRKDGDRNTE